MFHVEQIEDLKNILGNERIPDLDETMRLLSEYKKKIVEWNQRINLISRSDEGRIITRHFLQSIGIVKAISVPYNSSFLDLGSGAGLPGIPIKLVRQDLSVILAESVRKKADFLKLVIEELGLRKIQVHADRVDESHVLEKQVDHVFVRSVSNLTNLVRWGFPSLKEGGRLIAVKGTNHAEEFRELGKKKMLIKQICDYKVIDYNPYPELFSLGRSYLIVIKKRPNAN